jgi:hypothetical protein
MIYVIAKGDKKSVSKALKNYGDIYTWSEFLNHVNKICKRKKEILYTSETLSFKFDTSLNNNKKEVGLRQCLFLINDDIDVNNEITDKFKVVETCT